MRIEELLVRVFEAADDEACSLEIPFEGSSENISFCRDPQQVAFATGRFWAKTLQRDQTISKNAREVIEKSKENQPKPEKTNGCQRESSKQVQK